MRRQRRRGLLAGIFAAILLPVWLAFGGVTVGLAAVFDVNGAGVFELDGNVCHDANTVPPVDWGNQAITSGQCSGTDASPAAVGLFNHDYSQAIAPNTALTSSKTMSNSIICDDATATSTCLQGASSAGTALSTDSAFVTGGSKDSFNPQGNWQCTTKPVTPKDEIDNAYASLFTAPLQTATLTTALSSGTMYSTLQVTALSTNVSVGDQIRIGTQVLTVAAAAAAGATSITVNSFTASANYPVGTPVQTLHDLLYFGIERGVTTGTSNAGFWLMQNSVTCDPSTGLFTGNHANGDFLLFATFNSGGAICPNGATSTACVDSFNWVGGAGGSITTTPVEGGVACSISTVDLCGMVNTGNVQTPWAPHNTAATAITPNGFFEAGVDLSNFYGKLGLAVPCLSTFLADTRSSGTQGNAISSVLHDYISGSFSNCQAHIQTTPSSSSIKLGGSITDTATVTGTPGFPTPTGTVSFFVCGPLTSTTAAGPNCTSSSPGYTVLDNGSGPSPPAAVPLVNGSATSSSFTPTTVGTYCFAATYSGDSNYSSVSESRGTECFVVRSSSTTTAPSSTSVPLGSSVTDIATVTVAPSGGPTPTGTVSFYVCGPTATAVACTTSASNVTTLNAGSGPSPPAAVTLSSGSATSASFTPSAIGVYCFLAVYSGDSNYPGSRDNDITRECFTVRSSSTTTAPSASAIKLGGSVTDTATVTVSPSGGPAPTGTVSFYVCGPFTTATACTSSATGFTTLNAGSGPTPPAAVTLSSGSATSSSFTPSAVGIYCFLGIYSGDSNYPSSQDNDVTRECFIVRSSTTVTSPSPGSDGSITLGQSVTDMATVTGSPSGGPTPTGTVSFYVCGPDTVKTACLSNASNVTVLNAGSGPTPPAAVTLSGAGTATSASFTPTTAGIYCFLAVYSGDSNYPGSQDNDITRECFTASPAPSPLASTVTLDDTVTITKTAAAGQPSGDLTFTLFGPFTSQGAVTCTTPVATTVTVSHTSEQYDSVTGNGFWNAAVDVPLTNGTTGSNLWYAWGASFAPTNTNYASGSLACTSEQVNVQYGTGSGFSIPGGITVS